jgi:probable rRNA maturation factor
VIIVRKPVPGVSEATLARFAGKAARAVKLKGSINILITTSRELQALNRRFRAKDKPTDVLSFPPMAEFSTGLAGDIAISAEIAARNAKLLGHSTADEIKTLALHGILHLAGYDHEHDNGAMAQKEEKLRRSLGLPVSLTERSVRNISRVSRPSR